MTEGKVHILLSTYNGEKYLGEQLNSLKNQQEVTFSITVRDDNSSDKTCKILERYSKQLPMRIIWGKNIGTARSFLQLVQRVDTGAEYYAYCDQDDYWEPEKLVRAIEKLKNCDNSMPVLYYSDVKRVGPELETIKDPFKKNYHTEKFEAALIATAAPGCTMVFNRALLMLLKRHIPEYLTMHDSWTLQVCAAVGGTVIYDARSYIRYRQHSSNVIGGNTKMNYGKVRLFLYRIKKLFCWKIKPTKVAEELLRGYGDAMKKENNEWAIFVKDINYSFSKALHILFCGVIFKKTYTPYRIINLKFFLQALCKQA